MHEKVSYGYGKVMPSEKRRRVLGHFETIAHRYDLADALLSFGLHFFWRRKALRRLNLRPGERVLDLCGGTGDFAVMAARAVGPSGRVTVCDFSRTMMDRGRRKAARAGLDTAIHWMQGDAENMGFADDSFDSVIVGYGIRNFVFLERGLSEIRRVLKPGGRFLAMEFSIPRSFWLRSLYNYYSFRIMPKAGRLITGTAEPFHYLAESIRVFPAPALVQGLLTANNFSHAAHELMSDGLAVLYSGQKDSNPSKRSDCLPAAVHNHVRNCASDCPETSSPRQPSPRKASRPPAAVHPDKHYRSEQQRERSGDDQAADDGDGQGDPVLGGRGSEVDVPLKEVEGQAENHRRKPENRRHRFR